MSRPAPAATRAAATERGPRRGIDGLTVLTVYVVLLFAVPSGLTITALGSAGRPATLWALGAGLWWCWHQLQRQSPLPPGPRRVSAALFALLAVAGFSYACAMLRGLPTDEVSPADNGLLRLLAWAGILLVGIDGLPSVGELRVLLRRLAWAGGAMATLGILQFLTGNLLLEFWHFVPFTMWEGPTSDALDQRAGFIRASGTAIHPLEYGVVLAMAFPIALALAVENRSVHRLLPWLPVAMITVASLLSVSRSTLIGLAVGLIIMLPTLSRNVRMLIVTVGGALTVAIAVLVPGMIGTIRGLFTGLGSDPSTASRTTSYDIAIDYMSRFPVVGKGFGTFIAKYHIFDNQYLLLAIELGILGVIAFLILVVAGIVSAAQARRTATASLDRQLAQALVAALVAGSLLMAFFDGFAFSMSAGMLFLVLGLAGGARHLLAAGPPVPGQPVATR
ncbi:MULTISPECIES: O-antigen ligase family protein [Cryobacterium]|uniref:O-antigen ligase family protein n=1 Tax=Cryobacterium TaxID=69578 RepID=UPI000CD3E3D9|nr:MULTISPECIES: O-antigen ligase family protein [Cryobacterium]TFC42420.1 O-antigen ligase domain-containing protein [Cryobacterium sp. TMN-39-2]